MSTEDKLGWEPIIDTSFIQARNKSHTRRGYHFSPVEEEVIDSDWKEALLNYLGELPLEAERTAVLLQGVIEEQTQLDSYLDILGVSRERLQEINLELKNRLGQVE